MSRGRTREEDVFLLNRCKELEEQLETLRNATPEALARTFHEAYERLAPTYRYETRPDSAVAWEDVPQTNRALMCATAGEVLLWLRGESNPASEPKPTYVDESAEVYDRMADASNQDKQPS